ncbi:MAG TPA: OmpA family protein [Flavisolibacter sp.]|nr:OmpA family protein [Flavisolibacter sp.]
MKSTNLSRCIVYIKAYFILAVHSTKSHESGWVGLARAGAVVMYLEQKGIDGSRMHAVSKGAEEPVVPNTSEVNRRQNRRVVIGSEQKG